MSTKTILEKISDLLLNKYWIAVLVLVFLISTQLVDTFKSWAEIHDWIWGNKNALTLTLENDKGEFSRRLTQQAYRRIFWARNYVARVRKNLDSTTTVSPAAIDLAFNN